MGSIAQSSHTMRNIILVCCLGLALATGTDYAKQFAEFKQEFGKEYATAEEELERFHIFKAKAIEVHEHNKQNLPYKKESTSSAISQRKNSRAHTLVSRDSPPPHLNHCQQPQRTSRTFLLRLTGLRKEQ